MNRIVCIKNTNNNQNEILPGFVELESEYESKSLSCWNCCHECKEIKYIPLKYKDNIFHVHGIFCSDECSLRYLYDNYNSRELWEKNQLFNFYIKKIYGEYKDIVIPPNRILLKKFGGKMDIEDYRKYNLSCEIINPGVIIINNKNDKNIKKKNTDYLKLYRKKKQFNTILNKFD